MIVDIIAKIADQQTLTDDERAELLAWFEQASNAPRLLNSIFSGNSRITKLSQITGQLGEVTRGRFLSGNDGDPTDTTGNNPFTGVGMISPGLSVGSDEASLFGMNAGTPTFWLSALTGKILGGGGDVWIDDTGLNINSGGLEFNSIKWLDAADVIVNMWANYISDTNVFSITADATAKVANETTSVYVKSTGSFGDSYVRLSISEVSSYIISQLVSGTLSLNIRAPGSPNEFYLYDSIRDRTSPLPAAGWQPYAYPIAFDNSAALGSNVALAANGGSIALAIHIAAPMLLESVSVFNQNGASARAWRWDLYVQDTNTESSSENTLRRVASSNGSDSFTPGAASVRTLAATSEPVYIPPGYYWIVVQNTHATNTFAFATTAGLATVVGNVSMTKTTTNPNGATLDFVAATWTKRTSEVYGVRLNGQVFGQTTAF